MASLQELYAVSKAMGADKRAANPLASGMDAFGNRPTYVDKGRMKRGILAVGRQDVVPEGLTPFDSGIEVIGASSDHTILDLTPSGNAYEVGDILRFRLSYGALLALSTSVFNYMY